MDQHTAMDIDQPGPSSEQNDQQKDESIKDFMNSETFNAYVEAVTEMEIAKLHKDITDRQFEELRKIDAKKATLTAAKRESCDALSKKILDMEANMRDNEKKALELLDNLNNERINALNITTFDDGNTIKIEERIDQLKQKIEMVKSAYNENLKNFMSTDNTIQNMKIANKQFIAEDLEVMKEKYSNAVKTNEIEQKINALLEKFIEDNSEYFKECLEE